MLTQEETMTFSRTVRAEPVEVFRAFTHRAALRDWLCNAAEVEPRVGGRIYAWWNSGYYTAGVFTQLEPGKSLAFTWRGPKDPSSSEIRVNIEPGAEAGTSVVNVTHSGIGSGPGWEDTASQAAEGWEQALENLQSALETGIDLRLARRPMLGISSLDVLTPELQAKLGVPVSKGIWIGGLVQESGAERAGLRKDDVLVGLAGREINEFPDVPVALGKSRAGDRVDMTFYRGPERHNTTIELSKRPMTEAPETTPALASSVRERYETLDEELAHVVQGATEEEANYRPAPGEWNALEILAHLVAVEHDTQTWITFIAEDGDPENVFHSNDTGRVQALAAAYPTLPAMVEQLEREEAITCGMLENIPEAASRHKHHMANLAAWTTTFDVHHREHFEEIRSLLEAARR